MKKTIVVMAIIMLLAPSFASAASKAELQRQVKDLQTQVKELQATLSSIYRDYPDIRQAKDSTENALKELAVMASEADRLKCYDSKGKARSSSKAVYASCASLKKDFDTKYRPIFDDRKNWRCSGTCLQQTFLGDQRLLPYANLRKIIAK